MIYEPLLYTGTLPTEIKYELKEKIEMATYELPDTVKELFEQGENQYRIIDYASEMEMDNNQSMECFLDHIGATGDNIKCHDGTQVTLIHPDYGMMYVVDAGGLGDFFSHGFEVSLHESDND